MGEPKKFRIDGMINWKDKSKRIRSYIPEESHKGLVTQVVRNLD